MPAPQEEIEEALDSTLLALEATMEESPDVSIWLEPMQVGLEYEGPWDPEDWAAFKQALADRWGTPLESINIDAEEATEMPRELASCEGLGLYVQLAANGTKVFLIAKSGYWPKGAI